QFGEEVPVRRCLLIVLVREPVHDGGGNCRAADPLFERDIDEWGDAVKRRSAQQPVPVELGSDQGLEIFGAPAAETREKQPALGLPGRVPGRIWVWPIQGWACP